MLFDQYKNYTYVSSKSFEKLEVDEIEIFSYRFPIDNKNVFDYLLLELFVVTIESSPSSKLSLIGLLSTSGSDVYCCCTYKQRTRLGLSDSNAFLIFAAPSQVIVCILS